MGDDFYIVFREAPYEIVVYGPDGIPKRRLGRFGQGPSEFQAIRVLESNGSGDLFVFDSENARVTRLRSDTIVASHPIPEPYRVGTRSARVFEDGAYLLAGRSGDGAVLVKVSPEGEPEHSVLYMPGWGPQEQFAFDQQEGPGDTVWAVNTLTGDLFRGANFFGATDRLRNLPDWFSPSYQDLETAQADVHGVTGLYAISIDINVSDQGHLWIVSQVPNLVTDEGDTLVEAIDPISGDVLGSRIVDELARVFLASDVLLVRNPDNRMIPSYTVYRVELAVPPGVSAPPE